MRYLPTLFFKLICPILIVTCFLSSCNTYKQVPYFVDLPDSGKEIIKTIPYKQPVIQVDDILQITVTTIDPSNSAAFQANSVQQQNLGLGNASTTSLFDKTGGYLVDKNGDLQLPFINTVHLAGLTRLQARDTLTNRIALYFKNPTVDVRFANFKITVLGEVARPATYTVLNEKVTIFDALALAGDMTVYGKRDNVVLVRDSVDEKKLVRLNLNSKNIIQSPYFFLKQNDVVYVEPDKSKAATLDAVRTRNIALLGTILSFLIIFFSRVKF